MEQEKKISKDRMIWIDMIKVIAAFFVVMQHSVSLTWIDTVTNQREVWYLLNLVFMLSRPAVPLFLMCSGATILRKERNIKDIYMHNIWGIVRVYICWMLIYGITDMFQLEDMHNWRVVINLYLKNILFGKYHTWFIFTLIGLYIITPFLSRIVREKSYIIYFLLLSLIFTIFIPYISRIESFNRMNAVLQSINMHFVVGYTLYYVAGYFISNIEMTKKRGRLCIAFLMAVIVMAFFLSGKKSLACGTECQSVYGEFSILGFLMTILIFASSKYLFEKIKDNRSVYFIERATSLGIGIYLFHPMILPIFDGMNGLLSIVKGIIIWSISLVLMLLLSKNQKLAKILLH